MPHLFDKRRDHEDMRNPNSWMRNSNSSASWVVKIFLPIYLVHARPKVIGFLPSRGSIGHLNPMDRVFVFSDRQIFACRVSEWPVRNQQMKQVFLIPPPQMVHLVILFHVSMISKGKIWKIEGAMIQFL